MSSLLPRLSTLVICALAAIMLCLSAIVPAPADARGLHRGGVALVGAPVVAFRAPVVRFRQPIFRGRATLVAPQAILAPQAIYGGQAILSPQPIYGQAILAPQAIYGGGFSQSIVAPSCGQQLIFRGY